MKQKTVYIANDGSEWDHEYQAKFRDYEIEDEAVVRDWLEEIGAKPATATKALNAIMGFLNWKRESDFDLKPGEMDR